ncbi:MAG: hypothetical protein AAFZ52_15685, partial [Bacteroidota bacterium]
MDILTGFIIGVGVAIFATWFPGMLNMQAVATSLRAGRPKGYQFARGLAAALAIQVGVTIVFAKYLRLHPEVITLLKQSAIPIFLLAAAAFL